MSSQTWVRASLISVGLIYVLLLLVSQLGMPYYMDREFALWQHVKQDSHDPALVAAADLIYLGDSRAKAALLVNQFEQQSGQRLINLTLGGATPIEGYYTLKAALKQGTARDIIISYAPYHLTKIDTYWFRAVKFAYLQPGEYREVQRHARRLQEPSLLDDHYLNYRLKPGLYLTDALHGLLERRWADYQTTLDELRQSGGHYFFGREHGFSGLSEENFYGPFAPLPVLDLYLGKIIKLARARGATLYWYSMPFNRSSMDNLPEAYIQGFEDYLERLAGEHFIILNRPYAEGDALFGDLSHVYLGADKVTQDILQAFQTAKAAVGSGGGVAQGSLGEE